MKHLVLYWRAHPESQSNRIGMIKRRIPSHMHNSKNLINFIFHLVDCYTSLVNLNHGLGFHVHLVKKFKLMVLLNGHNQMIFGTGQTISKGAKILTNGPGIVRDWYKNYQVLAPVQTW